MEDRDIVALYLRRDEGAIKCTAEKYGSRLRALALGITGDRQSAEECENDAYLAAWSSIPPKRPEDHFFPFLARIVRDQALNLCRGRTAQKRSARVEELSRELEQCLPGGASAESELDRRELGRTLQLRYTPELQFIADDSIQHGAHILEVLRQVERQEESRCSETNPEATEE